jgi:hypothetical protein
VIGPAPELGEPIDEELRQLRTLVGNRTSAQRLTANWRHPVFMSSCARRGQSSSRSRPSSKVGTSMP